MVQVVNLNTADEHTLTLTHVGSDQQFLGIQSLLVRHPTAHTPVYIPSGPGARAHTSSSSLSSSSSTSSHIPPASSTVSRKTKHGGHHTKHAGKASATPATSPFAVSYSACPASSASSSSSSSSPSSAPPRSNSASSSSTSGLLNTEAAQTASSDDTSPGAIAVSAEQHFGLLLYFRVHIGSLRILPWFFRVPPLAVWLHWRSWVF